MKKLIVIMAVLAIAAPAMAFHAREGRSYECDSCHIPHKAGTLEDMPLWNSDTVLPGSHPGFTAYDSETMQATAGTPVGPSLLCLACHDSGASEPHRAINDAAGDLTGSHPMEFAYTGTLAADDKELVDPDAQGSSTKVNGEGTITEDLLSPSNGYVNCQSCHDIHIQGLSDETVAWSQDIQGVGDGSALPAGQLYDPAAPFGDYRIWADVDLDGVIDVDSRGRNVPYIDHTDTGEHSFRIPYLVNIPGIEWAAGWGADVTNADDYELKYGVLCKTCHIK
ncbi:MAG: hypothetical protein DRP66_01555 [Planctomycetota bacterium]|nr:MAG: hypothetical protein DRP66_01555 [Planctomycetota bacterium]